MDAAKTFPKGIQNFQVLGLVEGLLAGDARSSHGFNGLVETRLPTALCAPFS